MSSGRPVGEPVDDREGTAGPQRDDLLDVGEEVARLTETLAGWWTSVTAGAPAGQTERRAADGHDDEDDGARDDAADAPGQHHGGAHAHGDSPTGESCRVCPLCRVLDIARAARPDLLTQAAAAAETVAVLLREAAAGDRARGAEDVPPAGPADSDEAEPSGSVSGTRGTPIVVRDSGEVSTASDEQQEPGAPWA